MSSILIFGGEGQLAQCLNSIQTDYPDFKFKFLSRTEGDVLNLENMEAVFKSYTPDFVFNFAAYTAVDLAEKEQEQAFKINKQGAYHIAKCCKMYNSTLVHVSTDFVFEGREVKLLNELHDTQPISVYGASKLAGENQIKNVLDRYYIIRTSWLYSEYAHNFVKTMLKLANQRDELSIISDQIGSPTYAIDLAHVLMHIIKHNTKTYGLYHYSNEGAISWYDFAQAIFQLSAKEIKINPIRTEDYPTLATRPAFSVLDKSKIKNNFTLRIPYWRSSLEKCILKLKDASS